MPLNTKYRFLISFQFANQFTFNLDLDVPAAPSCPRAPHTLQKSGVWTYLEGHLIISDAEAIQIITGEGLGKFKRIGLGSVKGDLICQLSKCAE